MASVVECIKELQGHDLKEFLVQASTLTDDIAQQLIKKFASGPIWSSEISIPECKSDKALFRLYAFEDIGIIYSKIEHKSEKRYERRFYLTTLGKKLLNH